MKKVTSKLQLAGPRQVVAAETARALLVRILRDAGCPEATAQPVADHLAEASLSGVESHARLSIVHVKGKAEVSAVTDKALAGVPGSEEGVVVFKILRSAGAARDRGKVCIVGRNPEALWFDDYADRVIYDEAGLFDESPAEHAQEQEQAARS